MLSGRGGTTSRRSLTTNKKFTLFADMSSSSFGYLEGLTTLHIVTTGVDIPKRQIHRSLDLIL
jgi:hypothetical protein